MTTGSRKSAVFVLLALLLLPTVYRLSAKDRHYDYLLRGLLDAQECIHRACRIDFDGDGVPGSLLIDRTSPAEYYDSWLVAIENGGEILRLLIVVSTILCARSRS